MKLYTLLHPDINFLSNFGGNWTTDGAVVTLLPEYLGWTPQNFNYEILTIKNVIKKDVDMIHVETAI